MKTEVRYGLEGSRIDVLAEDEAGRQVFIEVKNTTLKVGTTACFPDAVTQRGLKHLRELQGVVGQGHRAAIAFFVHREDVTAFDAAREVDPEYARELECAAAQGVEVLPLRVAMNAFDDQKGGWALTWELPGLLSWVRRP